MLGSRSTPVEWLSSRLAGRCPLCSDDGPHVAVVEVARPGWRRHRDRFARCASCTSIFVPGFEPIDTTQLGWFPDFYLEQGAGIDVMVGPLQRIEPGAVRRYLEIGCGYGFALDFARAMLGWDAIGVDPSAMARAGARELGLPVVATAFGPQVDLGSVPFDLIFASEVLEHVARPLDLLTTARDRLAADGLLVLTTPDARAIDPTQSPATLLRVLSPGHHAILFTPDSLDRALRAAGFTALRIEPVDATLRAFAALSPTGLERLRAATPDGSALVRRYLAERSEQAAPGSALACGLAYRRFKSDVHRGDWPAAVASRELLATALRQRHGLDLERPATVPNRLTRARRRTLAGTPWNLPNALCLAGLHELAGKGDAARALVYFATARDRGGELLAAEQRFGFADGETAELLWESRRHVPIAAAAVAPQRALLELARLAAEEDAALDGRRAASLRRTRAQTYLQLVHHGAAAVAAPLAARVEADLAADPVLARELEPELRFALGLATADPVTAARHFAAAADDRPAADESAARCALREQARRHLAESRRRSGERAAPRDLALESVADPEPARDAPAIVAERLPSEVGPLAGVVLPLDVVMRTSPAAVRILVAAEEPGGGWRSVALPATGWRTADRLDLAFAPLAAAPGRGFVLAVFASSPGDGRPTETLVAAARQAAAGRPPIALDCRSTPADPSLLLPPDGMAAHRRVGLPHRRPVAHGVEVYWRDAHGVCIGGWVHAFGEPIRRVRLASDTHGVETERLVARPELHDLFPGAATAGLAGFTLHLPVGPGVPLRLEVATDDGLATLPLDLPAHSLPPRPPHVREDHERNLRRFAALLNERGPRPTVLEIGVRDARRDRPDPAVLRRRALYRNVRVIGLDIHPGPGVDLVGDAHRLTSFLRPGSVDAVLSASVLEHLHAPWLAAAEINRVLRPGGLVYHLAPTAWPEHSQPNDFWRFTTAGLGVLFGPDTGFAVLASSPLWPATVVPDPGWRDEFLAMPSVTANSTSDILAQKVRDLPPGAVAWPTEAGADAERARAYPLGALAARP